MRNIYIYNEVGVYIEENRQQSIWHLYWRHVTSISWICSWFKVMCFNKISIRLFLDVLSDNHSQTIEYVEKHNYYKQTY